MNETEYSYLKRKIRQLLNIDVNAYKSKQMRRRLEAFVAHRATDGPYRFCKKLEEDQATLKELKDMLTINVSEFFRDSQQFGHLKSAILPQLSRTNPRLNIWTAGCSHGAEPYSVAIVLDGLPSARGCRILASDIDVKVLKRAMAGGPYQPNEVKNVPQWQLHKYFTASDESYTVVEQLRRRVEFRQHNLLADPFEQGFDLVLCRNVMIYFSTEVKQRLFQQFHACLKPGGVLFLGGTEALLGDDSEGFEKLSTNFYRKSGAVVAEARRELAA